MYLMNDAVTLSDAIRTAVRSATPALLLLSLSEPASRASLPAWQAVQPLLARRARGQPCNRAVTHRVSLSDIVSLAGPGTRGDSPRRAPPEPFGSEARRPVTTDH